jgi:hypothetical protein
MEPGRFLVKNLTVDQFFGIMDCVDHFCSYSFNEEIYKNFFTISIWFPDIANKKFNSNTPPNGFLIKPRIEENYTSEKLLSHAKKIWDKGLIPVEVVKTDGASYFAVIKSEYYSGKIDSPMLNAETTIPSVKDFETQSYF